MAKMSARIAAFIAVFAIVLSVVSPSNGQATAKTLSTNITLVNLGTSSASVSVGFYQVGGAAWITGPSQFEPFALAANGGQRVVTQYFDPVMTGGRGSAVIASDQPLGSMVQLLARPPQVATQGAYIGQTASSFTFFAPIVLKQVSGSSAVLVIQNASPDKFQNINLSFTTSTGSPGVASYNDTLSNIAPNSTYYYDMATQGNGIPSGWYGSVEANGTQGPIGLVVNLFSGANTLQTYNAFPSSSTASKWFIPLFASRLLNATSTPVTIQNVSGSTSIPTNGIVLTCTPHPGSTNQTNPLTISNSAGPISPRQTFIVNPVTNFSIPTDWYGGCVVTTNGQQTITVVQQRRPNVSDDAAAYEAVRDSGRTSAIAPLVAKQSNNFSTVLTIQNVSNLTANFTLEYKPNNGAASTIVSINNVPAGRSIIRSLRTNCGANCEPSLPVGFVGSAIVTSTQSVDGYVQLTTENTPAGVGNGDFFMAHGLFTR
jgi:hypothetical protein